MQRKYFPVIIKLTVFVDCMYNVVKCDVLCLLFYVFYFSIKNVECSELEVTHNPIGFGHVRINHMYCSSFYIWHFTIIKILN